MPKHTKLEAVHEPVSELESSLDPMNLQPGQIMKRIGNRLPFKASLADFIYWSENNFGLARGPLIQEYQPYYLLNVSGAPWVKGITKDGKTCWV